MRYYTTPAIFIVYVFAQHIHLVCTSLIEDRIVDILSDVTISEGYAYDLKDDHGAEMSCVHVDFVRNETVSSEHLDGDRYIGLYHSNIKGSFEVRLASSANLIDWTFRKTLLQNADMPYLYRVPESSWLMLVHEQWMNPNSQLPSRVGFKLWYDETDLVSPDGTYFNSFVAPLTVGNISQLEGTPNVYDANITKDEETGFLVVNADIGFHFNDENGKDQVASSHITRFGPTALDPIYRDARVASTYNNLFISHGAIGNIGQRAPGKLMSSDVHFSLQEANIGSMPPTIWADWRIWMYRFSAHEIFVPDGTGTIEMMNIKTHKNSTAVGNPSWHKVPCPDSHNSNNNSIECVFVSYFLFGEGAKPGEAGVLAFWNRVDDD
jgi:hypothetical protein